DEDGSKVHGVECRRFGRCVREKNRSGARAAPSGGGARGVGPCGVTRAAVAGGAVALQPATVARRASGRAAGTSPSAAEGARRSRRSAGRVPADLLFPLTELADRLEAALGDGAIHAGRAPLLEQITEVDGRAEH